MKRSIDKNSTELQQIISALDLNAQTGEMVRAIYRKGRASHSDELRDARKVLFYAQAEVRRLEALQPKPIINELYTAHPSTPNAWDEGERRMGQIGLNGNDGLAYEPAWIPSNGKEPDLPDGKLIDVKFAGGDVLIGCRPGSFAWADSTAYDITHYRIHQPNGNDGEHYIGGKPLEV